MLSTSSSIRSSRASTSPARFGFTEKSDVKNERYSGIVGFGDDKTHIVIGAEYVNQDPLFDRERNFSPTSFGTTTFPGVARFDGGVFIAPAGRQQPERCGGPGTVPLPDQRPRRTRSRARTITTISPTAGRSVFDLAAATGITLDQNRLNVFASADRQLIGNHVVAFVDFLYASNYSQSYLNAQPFPPTRASGFRRVRRSIRFNATERRHRLDPDAGEQPVHQYPAYLP